MTIRNDATRLRIGTRDRRRPRAVVSRQGQVLLDTDFDQQAGHVLERMEIETRDTMGSPGRLVVPTGDDGFKIVMAGAPANFDIGMGHGYLDGWLLENVGPCKLGTQPHPRTGDTVTAPSVILVKSLVRMIDPAEETGYADVALGDAQASGRALNDWQVLPMPVAATAGPVSCATVKGTPEWTALTAPSSGLLRVDKAGAAPSTDPCSLTPGGGYTRLENLLYRIEVHGGDAAAGFPTVDGPRLRLHNLKLKLSRRNASLMARITGIAGSEITVTPPALDPLNWFAPGLFAEIVSIHDDVDPRAALANERLFRVANADDSRVTLEATAAQIAATLATTSGQWFLRLWDAFADGSGIATVSAPGSATDSAAIDLGDGLTITLTGGSGVTFRRGDYWTCAARADGSIGWLDGGAPAFQTPHGPQVRYAPLAVTNGTATAGGFEDCRIPAATLTDKALLYRGGDGQSLYAPVAAGGTFVPLAGRLRVAVMRGRTPVAGARIRWGLVTGSPDSRVDGVAVSSGGSAEMLTDAEGLCEVTWAVDAGRQDVLHRVQASLVDAPPDTPPIVFSAIFESAARTSYRPGGCNVLLGVDNVQEALDTLCANLSAKPTALTLESILLMGPKKKTIELIREKLILNALEVPFDAFDEGIFFGVDGGPLESKPRPFDPIAEIELDLPYPTIDSDRWYWSLASNPGSANQPTPAITGPFAFNRIRLDGSVATVDKGPNELPGLIWKPSPMASGFLRSIPVHGAGQRITPDFIPALKASGWKGLPRAQRLLCRIRLRAPHLWVADRKTGERIYLNAEHLGIAAGRTDRELLQGEVDPQRAGDLDMFVYLTWKEGAVPQRPV